MSCAGSTPVRRRTRRPVLDEARQYHGRRGEPTRITTRCSSTHFWAQCTKALTIFDGGRRLLHPCKLLPYVRRKRFPPCLRRCRVGESQAVRDGRRFAGPTRCATRCLSHDTLDMEIVSSSDGQAGGTAQFTLEQEAAYRELADELLAKAATCLGVGAGTRNAGANRELQTWMKTWARRSGNLDKKLRRRAVV